MTCDDATDVCPGTKLTCNCTCSVNSTSAGLIWRLPGSETITLDEKVGNNGTTTNGLFIAVVTSTNNTGGVLEYMLIYTATESLVNGTILSVKDKVMIDYSLCLLQLLILQVRNSLCS